MQSDTQVKQISQSLTGKEIDLVITGSIAACESVKLIRSLRRLGAKVYPWLTQSALQFTTKEACIWAAGHRQIQCGIADPLAEHIGSKDALAIVPATANFISELSLGLASSPASALALSYSGQPQKPALILPCMHQSMWKSPQIQKSVADLPPHFKVLSANPEEDKLKAPSDKVTADEVSHHINNSLTKTRSIYLNMGGTKGFIDDVRFIGNSSSGELGSLIGEELYRHGHQTHIACGESRHRPQCFSSFTRTSTLERLHMHAEHCFGRGVEVGIFTAAVLDYTPVQRATGKMSSDQKELSIKLAPTPKLIRSYHPSNLKIGFKLTDLQEEADQNKLALKQFECSGLNYLVVNHTEVLEGAAYHALVYKKSHLGCEKYKKVSSKQELAQCITHIINKDVN